MKSLSDEERLLLLLLAERNTGIKHFSKQNPNHQVWSQATDAVSFQEANEGICYICNQPQDFRGMNYFEKYDAIITHGLNHIKESKLKLFT